MAEEERNPFLISPGSIPPPAPGSDAVPLESGTRRVPVSRLPGAPTTVPPGAAPPPAGAPIPGLAPPVVDAPSPAARPAVPPPAAPLPAEAILEAQAVPTAPSPTLAAAWSIRIGDAAPAPLVGAVLLGRDPAPRADAPSARLVPVVDPDKTVSKTHALIALRDGAADVTDLSSTNGTTVVDAGGSTLLGPGGRYRLVGDATVYLGSFPLRVEATAAMAGGGG